MLKVELHAHTSEDPQDRVPHSSTELIDRAVELEYRALSITLHDKQLQSPRLTAYAKEKGLVLLGGVERTIRGKHVLLINFPERAESVETFEELAELKKENPNGLVIAPHPFYPGKTCLRSLMNRYADLFDAVELNCFYTSTVDFNRAAVRWAQEHGKTVVGNSDVHRLVQLGRTFTLVEAIPDPDSICCAIREGRVKIKTDPLSWKFIGEVLGKLLFDNVVKTLRL
ncbi:MAG TPA: PHP domain-containing protein [Acidobacteriota bacterium]|jgi:hypothetical protein